MNITLCSSAQFFERLWDIEKALKSKGYGVFLPSMRDYHHESSFAKIQHGLMKEHFKKIDGSHAIYVANYDKNGIAGYIGGNSFAEMVKAFDRGIPIFLLNRVPGMTYLEEIIAMQPIVVGENLELLDRRMKEFYRK